MSSFLKTALFILILVALVGVGYLAYKNTQTDQSILSSGVEQTGEAALKTEKFLSRLQDLGTIKNDTKLFDDPRFISLEDFRQPLVDEPTGRPNPFKTVE